MEVNFVVGEEEDTNMVMASSFNGVGPPTTIGSPDKSS
jgi:hypothetical protein